MFSLFYNSTIGTGGLRILHSDISCRNSRHNKHHFLSIMQVRLLELDRLPPNQTSQSSNKLFSHCIIHHLWEQLSSNLLQITHIKRKGLKESPQHTYTISLSNVTHKHRKLLNDTKKCPSSTKQTRKSISSQTTEKGTAFRVLYILVFSIPLNNSSASFPSQHYRISI